MRLTCPCCGATESLDSALSAAAAKDFALQALRAPDALAERLYRYLGLFRPRERVLSWPRAAKLLAELNDAIAAGQIQRDGRAWAAPLDYWMQALDATLDARPTLVLPLKNHGYLYAIIAGISSSAAARAEEAEEARRRRPREDRPAIFCTAAGAVVTGTRTSQPGIAAALAQNERFRAKIPLNESYPITTPDGARINTDTGEVLTATRPTRVPPPEQFRALSERLRGTTRPENTGETHGQGD